MTTTQTLGKVVGANVRRLRQAQDSTLEDLSRVVRGLGYEWSVSRVVAIERGVREPKMATLLILANALNCAVRDLLETDAEWLDLGTTHVNARDYCEMFAGVNPPEISSPADEMSNDDWAATRGWGSAEQMEQTLGSSIDLLRAWARRSGLVEERTCRMLDLNPDVLNTLTDEMWDRTLGDMRDSIARRDDRPAGDVTAELREQIREAIADWPREQRQPTEYPD
jgi:transcriptional regulator with XRE-family HTH domain